MTSAFLRPETGNERRDGKQQRTINKAVVLLVVVVNT